MKRRIAALLLVFIMILGMTVMAQTETETPPVVSAATWRNAEFLNALGIVEGRGNGEFMMEELLTRAELVIILLRTMGIEQVDTEGIVFSDVPEDHWAYYEIGYAYSLGLINGIGGGLFAPDEAVTYNQALKMIITLLGYDFMAEGKGGYPAGYQYVANQLDLLDGLSGGAFGEDEISRGAMMTLVANALETEVAEMYAIGSNGDSMESHLEKGKMLMSIYLGVKKLEGRVNSHYYASVSGALTENTDEVKIGNTLLHEGETDVYSMLGENVVAYVREDATDEDEFVILYVERAKSTDVVSFTSNDVDFVSRNEIKYTIDTKKTRLNISNAMIYLNGAETLNLNPSDLTCAFYKLIENNDGQDILWIEAYTDAVVRAANAPLEMLYLEENVSIKLEDYEKFILKNEAGEDITLESIAPQNIISYRDGMRNGNRIFYGIVSAASAEGVLSAQGELGNYTAWQIDDADYRVSADLFGDVPALGTRVKIFTNCLGHIAAIDTNVAQYTYGYLIAAGREKTFDNMQFKIFTDKGKIELFSSKDKVEINGTPREQDELLSETSLFPTGGAAKAQLIRYKVSAKGEIRSIEIASDSVVSADNRETFGRNYQTTSSADGRWVNTFSSKYIIDENTLYFKVPVGSNLREKDYKVSSNLEFEVFDEYTHPACFYDIDEDNVIGVIYKEIDYSSGVNFAFGGSDIKWGVVTGKMHARAEDDFYPVLKVATTALSKEFNVLIDESESPIKMKVGKTNIANVVVTGDTDPYKNESTIPYDAVDVGDIMIFRVDPSTGIAYDAQMLVRRSYPIKWEGLNGANASEVYSVPDRYRWARSVVTHVSDKGVLGTVGVWIKDSQPQDGFGDVSAEYERLFLKSSVLIYDSTTGEIKDGTWEDIQEGDEFAILHRQIYPQLFLIYR